MGAGDLEATLWRVGAAMLSDGKSQHLGEYGFHQSADFRMTGCRGSEWAIGTADRCPAVAILLGAPTAQLAKYDDRTIGR